MISFTLSAIILIWLVVFLLGLVVGGFLTMHKVKGKEEDSRFVIFIDKLSSVVTVVFGWFK